MTKDQEILTLKRLLHARNYMLRNIRKDIRDDLRRGGMAPSWEGIADAISALVITDLHGHEDETVSEPYGWFVDIEYHGFTREEPSKDLMAATTPLYEMHSKSGLPMESAPRDGTEIILQVKSRAGISHKFLVGHFMPGGHCIEDHPPIAPGWYFWNGRMFDEAAEPERWWPLPKAVEVDS